MTVEDAAKGQPFLAKSKTKTEQMNNRHLSRLLVAGTICLLAVCVQPAVAIMAGDETGTPWDSPEKPYDGSSGRLIYNSDTSSPFAGVGSITPPSGWGTGIPLSRWHVLTAAHIVDKNKDREADSDPWNFTFNLNYGSDYSSRLPGLDVTIHPSFGVYGDPDDPYRAFHDDLAIITLSTPIPEGVPTYDLYRSPLNVGKTLDFVGYGKSGYGDIGYSSSYPASDTVKRWGQNKIGSRESGDDPGDSGYELWKADFDGPGGNGLGNDVETTFGEGDSGGPAFYDQSGQYRLAGINTFVSGDFPRFGSGLGGILIYPYLTWIDMVRDAPILLPGDVDGNLFVCEEDLSIIINNWGLSGATREQGDLSGNHIVDGPDYTEVLSHWGNGIPPEPSELPEAIAAMPEPATVWMMILAGAILARRKRKQ